MYNLTYRQLHDKLSALTYLEDSPQKRETMLFAQNFATNHNKKSYVFYEESYWWFTEDSEVVQYPGTIIFYP